MTRVACVQLCATPDWQANLECTARLVGEARDGGAEVVLLPEAFAFLGPEAEKRKILEPLPRGGPILDRCRSIANEHRVHLILGGFHEDIGDPDKCANTLVHIDPAGGIGTTYRKIHMFDIALDDGTALNESARTAAGSCATTAVMPFGVLGLSICYDLRFPYLYQQLIDLGAIALCVPSAFTKPTGAAHWHTLLRARAIECQSYVLAPAQHGHHFGKRHSYGHSLIIDPWGEVLAELPDGDGVIIADVDPQRVADVRRQLPSLDHRRTLTGAQ